jgi:hypothetical protein
VTDEVIVQERLVELVYADSIVEDQAVIFFVKLGFKV